MDLQVLPELTGSNRNYRYYLSLQALQYTGKLVLPGTAATSWAYRHYLGPKATTMDLRYF
jgi:hypothetical protein